MYRLSFCVCIVSSCVLFLVCFALLAVSCVSGRHLRSSGGESSSGVDEAGSRGRGLKRTKARRARLASVVSPSRTVREPLSLYCRPALESSCGSSVVGLETDSDVAVGNVGSIEAVTFLDDVAPVCTSSSVHETVSPAR